VLLGLLHTLYERHTTIEDSQIFPLAGELLTASQLAEVGCEMGKRRGVDVEKLKANRRRFEEEAKWTSKPNLFRG